MIQGYFDGSGTHVGSKVLVIAGFIGAEEAFVDLDQHWEKVLDDPRWPTRLPEFQHRDPPESSQVASPNRESLICEILRKSGRKSGATTQFGGTYNGGTVFELIPNGDGSQIADCPHVTAVRASPAIVLHPAIQSLVSVQITRSLHLPLHNRRGGETSGGFG